MSDQVKVLSATDKSSKALLAAVASVSGAVVLAQETLPALMVQIENAQSDLAGIETETKEKARKAKVELSLQVEENETKVLENLLKKLGLARISVAELADLQGRLEAAQGDNSGEVNKAVAITKSGLETTHTAALAAKDADHKVAVAEKDADIRALTQEVGFQAKQINSLEKTIDAEREARVTEAQARGVAAVHVTNSK